MTYSEIERVLSACDSISFEPNENKRVGLIILGFTNPALAFLAYKDLIDRAMNDLVHVKISTKEKLMSIEFRIENQNVSFNLRNRRFSAEKFNAFKDVNGGGPAVALLVGFSPVSANRVVLEDGMSPLVVTWDITQ